jgi:hypothetical protein
MSRVHIKIRRLSGNHLPLPWLNTEEKQKLSQGISIPRISGGGGSRFGKEGRHVPVVNLCAFLLLLIGEKIIRCLTGL